MEEIQCPLCGSDDGESLLRRSRPRHVVCRRCGLVYQNPRPRPETMRAYYEEGYWEERETEAGESGGGDAGAVTVAHQRADAIVEWVGERLRPGGRVVEVGCGHGEILARVRDRLDCRAVGIEPSAAQAERARRRLGLEVLEGELDQALENPDRLQGTKLLILSHVFEHVYQPLRTLEQCRALLADDGLLWIEVPNILHPNPAKRLAIWLAPEHNFYFSAATLGWFLTAAGFEEIRRQEDVFLRILARPAAPGNAPRPAEYRAVRRAIRHHGLRYWTAYLGRRLRRPGDLWTSVLRRLQRPAR